ncbi:M20 family metallopeptidase [Bacillus marinisedimentorum]|uniref:M20 family metallopeptidase n=1 Tax=Bacillus marinisedimentorum TaxID=1821260 RepID=UPI0007E238AB|nr:M20 family metallopeptidase [Bacillus marinisedimentorum]
MLERINSLLEKNFGEMSDIRRHLHMNPELSFEEVKTPEFIADFHNKLGLEVKTGVGGRGVTAKLEGGKPGKTVALRADFDALAIQDEKDVPYKSQVPGVMHACGHDAHTATLLGLAKALHAVKDELEGDIVFIHQFAEEITPGGAQAMIKDGCLEGVDAIFGTHVWSPMPFGQVGYRKGYLMAAADRFDLEVTGKGGHGAMPQETIDPIMTAANILQNFQTIVSRKVDPLKSAVLTVSSFHSGDAFNVIPGKAELKGTVRTFDESVRTLVEQSMELMAESICNANGAECSFSYERGYPALWNHSAETEQLAEAAKTVVPPDQVVEMEPIMGGEDFAYYLKEVPGAFFFTGARNEAEGAHYPHHHAKFDIDEKAMLIAAKVMAAAAIRFQAGEPAGDMIGAAESGE